MYKPLSGSRNPGRRILRIPAILLIVMLLWVVSSCRKQEPSSPPILREGDALNGMTVASGIPNAPPLEAFCRFEEGEDVTSTIDCQVPLLPKLDIGHMIGTIAGAFRELDGSQLDWQVILDGYQLNLDTFDQRSYVEPGFASSPSKIREVFRQHKTWDIVLINPTFGRHTLLCMAKTKSEVYSWVVNFMVMSTRGPLNMVDRLPAESAAGRGAGSGVLEMERRSIAWNN